VTFTGSKETALRRLIISILVVSAFLAGCSKESKEEIAASKNLSDVKAAVLADLKDPTSAQFGKFEMVSDNRACIEVNAKNSYGGYAGTKPFFVKKIDGQWVAITSMDFPFDLCVMTMRDGKL
jgi:uncharacterized protein YceK